jgi:hypothetical protein
VSTNTVPLLSRKSRAVESDGCRTAPAPSVLADSDIAAFQQQVQPLVEKYASVWEQTSKRPVDLGRRWTPPEQRANHRAAEQLLDDVELRLQTGQSERASEAEWTARARDRLQCFLHDCLGFSPGSVGILSSPAYSASTRSFIEQASKLNRGLGPEEIFQGLRNVWIVNSLQHMLQLEVRLTPAVFGYSMLYPLTDNYLDRLGLSLNEKQLFCQRLRMSLRGLPSPPRNARERHIQSCVAQIQSEFPIPDWPDVHSSLVTIHDAQVDSLRQQHSARGLRRSAILEMSVRKGGASVLADGFLAAGKLTPSQADACFGYGVFLQFMDDLQDAESDRRNGSSTLFSAQTGRSVMDAQAARVCRFMDRVLERSSEFVKPRQRVLTEMIRDGCRMLLYESVATQRVLFGKAYLERLETFSPMKLQHLAGLRGRLVRLAKHPAIAAYREKLR